MLDQPRSKRIEYLVHKAVFHPVQNLTNKKDISDLGINETGLCLAPNKVAGEDLRTTRVSNFTGRERFRCVSVQR